MTWLRLAWDWLPLVLLVAGLLVARWRAGKHAHEDGLFDERASVFVFWLAMFAIAALMVRGIQALAS